MHRKSWTWSWTWSAFKSHPRPWPRPRWLTLPADYLSATPVHHSSRAFIHRISFSPGLPRQGRKIFSPFPACPNSDQAKVLPNWKSWSWTWTWSWSWTWSAFKSRPRPRPRRGPRPRWRMLAANYLSSAPVHRPSRGFIHRISFYPGCVRSLPNGLSGARKLDNVDNMLDKNVFQIMMSPSM